MLVIAREYRRHSTPELTFCHLAASSQKRALQEAATHIAPTVPFLTPEQIFEQLIGREKLGSTAIGNGVAIPHCRLDGCPRIITSLFTLQGGVDFQAFDRLPVDVMFVLLVPTAEADEHLKVLATIAGQFEQADYRDKLLAATDSHNLYEAAVLPGESQRTANR